MKTIAVTVQKQDTWGATRRNSCNCPVARAIKRRFSRAKESGVSVSGRSVSFYEAHDSIDLPMDVSNRIAIYDDGAAMLPFTFTIEVPDGIALLAPIPALLAEAK